MENKQPWYKSLKKVLAVIAFACYWGMQVIAVIEDPSVIIDLSLENSLLILGLLGIKKFGSPLDKKDK